MDDLPPEDDPADEAVGYGKPPKAHQFKPGQSGNSKGRPPKSRNIKTLITDIMAQPVWITNSGRRRKIRTDEAMLQRLREKALGGDLKAVQMLLQLAIPYLAPETNDNGAHEMSAEERAILEAYVAYLKGGKA